MNVIGFTTEFCPVCQRRTVYFIALTNTDLGPIKVKICEVCYRTHLKDMIKD